MLLAPEGMVIIIETSNHITQNEHGNQRREVTERFCEAVMGAFNGKAL